MPAASPLARTAVPPRREYFSIRARLLALSFAAVAPVAALLIFFVHRQNLREREVRIDDALEHARHIAARIDDQIGDFEALLLPLSLLVSPDPRDIQKNETLLTTFRAPLPGFVLNVKAHAADGGALGSSTGRREPVPPGRSYVSETIARHRLTFTAPGRSVSDGSWATSAMFPLAPRDGIAPGVVGVTFALARIGVLLETPILGDTLPPGSLVSVLSHEGTILARNVDPERWIGQNSLDNPRVREAISGTSRAYEVFGPNGEPRVIAFASCTRAPWHIYARVPSADVFAEAEIRLRNAILLCAGAILLALGLAWTVSARISHPINQLTAEVQAFGAEGGHRPATIGGGGEVRVLAGAFNQMLVALDRREAELRATLALQRAILAHAGHAIFSTDAAGLVTSFNPAAEKLLGYSAAEAIGHLSLLALHDPAELSRRVPQIAQELGAAPDSEFEVVVARARRGLPDEREWTFRRKDGANVPVLRTMTELRAAAGEAPGFLVLAIDLSDRRRAEDERRKLEQKMQETQKLESLGVLAGGIAHDFNNLLTGVIGNVSLARMELPPNSPVEEQLDQINQLSRRAADLCRQMLAYSGKGRFVVQQLDLSRLVEETTHLLQLSISKKALLRFDLGRHLPPVKVDATQLRQVIMNLVINASDAIGDRSGVISLRTGQARVDRAYLGGTLHAPELAEGDYVFLEVADNGCGMAPETQARIFDPFFTTKFTGRGLGLAAVLGIVRGHGGALKVYSELGRGTTFKLLLPTSATATENPAAAPAPRPATWRSTGTVLVADDEETIRTAVSRMLRAMGFDVALVADGREAVAAYRAQPDRFRLVLLDLTMPHLDGEQAFAELRRIEPRVRVVLMSGFNEHEAASSFRGKGIMKFLQKPFGLEELRSTLQAALAEPEA